MKILYGVQGTGNGHVTRARALAPQLREVGIEVDFLFSGRAREKYFDMAEFGEHWQSKSGLTFIHKAGQLNVLQTIHHNSIKVLHQDIKALDLSSYDAVLTDFEPITAWAAKRQGKPCIGIGHQYAFLHDVPKLGDTLVARSIMKHFAPVDISLGLHWHHFGAPILPPIAETHPVASNLVEEDKILVYFGFEDPEHVIPLLEKFPQFTFMYYGPFEHYESEGNIQFKPLSRDGFKHDLGKCGGVISNAGFELASESIQLGKKLLVKPLKGQMEQLSNAKALEELGLGMSMQSLSEEVTGRWLKEFSSRGIQYPNVAKAIAQWVANGQWHNKQPLIDSLWQATKPLDTSNPQKQGLAA